MPARIRFRVQARGRRVRTPKGEMNRLERRYADEVLEPLLMAGQLVAWWFERFTFKLAGDCRYTPDFIVQLPDGTLEARETKGQWRDDAKVKIRLAADQFPFRFVALQWDRKAGWTEQEF